MSGKSYNKMYGTEPRYNDLRYNEIPYITMRSSHDLEDRTQNLPRYNDIISTQSQFKQNIEFNTNNTNSLYPSMPVSLTEKHHINNITVIE